MLKRLLISMFAVASQTTVKDASVVMSVNLLVAANLV